MRQFCLLGLGLFGFCSILGAQQVNGLHYQNSHRLSIRQAADTIRFDGDLKESAWRTADTAFITAMHFPTDVGLSHRKTIVRTTYNNQYLYIGVIAYDTSKFLRGDKQPPFNKQMSG